MSRASKILECVDIARSMSQSSRQFTTAMYVSPIHEDLDDIKRDLFGELIPVHTSLHWTVSIAPDKSMMVVEFDIAKSEDTFEGTWKSNRYAIERGNEMLNELHTRFIPLATSLDISPLTQEMCRLNDRANSPNEGVLTGSLEIRLR